MTNHPHYVQTPVEGITFAEAYRAPDGSVMLRFKKHRSQVYEEVNLQTLIELILTSVPA